MGDMGGDMVVSLQRAWIGNELLHPLPVKIRSLSMAGVSLQRRFFSLLLLFSATRIAYFANNDATCCRCAAMVNHWSMIYAGMAIARLMSDMLDE